jgi:hypothetical protein
MNGYTTHFRTFALPCDHRSRIYRTLSGVGPRAGMHDATPSTAGGRLCTHAERTDYS